jgi:hypothetical protein
MAKNSTSHTFIGLLEFCFSAFCLEMKSCFVISGYRADDNFALFMCVVNYVVSVKKASRARTIERNLFA